MQEQRSRTAIRSWYRAQRVAARRDRNVGATSSQCTQLHFVHFVHFVQCVQVHLCAMHPGAFFDVMHSNIEKTSLNALSTFFAT